MGNIDSIIKKVLSDSKLSVSKIFENKIYTDQPILRKASQMESYLPEKYKEMRAIATTPAYLGRSEAWIFVKQANFMSKFEDDFDYIGECVRYFPTYQKLSDTELRGYFSWRTKVRKDIINETSLSFVYLYIYELLNCVGYNDPSDAFSALKKFWIKYSEIDSRIDRFAILWMCDFVAFYGLDKEQLSGVYDFSFDEALETLIKLDASDEKLFEALTSVSSYNVLSSKGYKKKPEAYVYVIGSAYRMLSEYFDVHRKNRLYEKLFGSIVETTYNMFMSAVFCGRNNHHDGEYSYNSVHSYSCKAGVWTRRKCFGTHSKSTELGTFIKACDSMIRVEILNEAPLAEGKETKLMLSFIKKAVENFIALEKDKELKRIEIDITKLSGIRTSADMIRDKLIVEDELSDIEDNISEIAIETIENTDKSEKYILDPNERVFLLMLIDKSDYNAFLRKKGLMASIIADSINEKLFEFFGDTVIEFDEDNAYIIDDYISDIKNYC